MDFDFDNFEFKNAFELINETNQTFFLTGKAGTGKSTFLEYMVKTISKNFVVVAPTGIAAINVGGVTIHSFFQFLLRPLLPEDDCIKVFWKDSPKRKLITSMDTLIIDEISMVRADLVDGIDYSLRRNGGNPNLPFGGKQVVFIGDIFQLEPVTIKKSGAKEIINEIYGSSYFYNAKVFNRLKLFTIELSKVYRQVDPMFINLLDKVRVKEISQKDIDKLNSRVFSDTELKKNEFAITLTSKNDLAERVNSAMLDELSMNIFIYLAEVSGEFDESRYPTEQELKLKQGAQVMFNKNDIEKRWVNGTIGIVSELTETSISVKLANGSIYPVERKIWENSKYHYNKELKKIEQEIIGTFEQYPLKLAWAITIHKSQGLTFDKVIIDFGTGTFASGQAYVALSRLTSFEGLFLKHKMQTTDIFIDEEIKEFSKLFNDRDLLKSKIEEGKETYRFLKFGDFDSLGKYYFKKANESIIELDIEKAYENILLGFDYVVCDCKVGNWILQDIENALQKSESFNCKMVELNLVQAYAFWQNDKFEIALAGIDSYIQFAEDKELGYYLKGRILSLGERFNEAMECYYKSLSIKETNRTLYRIGRTKEEIFKENGLAELYKVSLNNVISHATAHFAKYSKNRGILLPNSNSWFVYFFNNRGDYFFLYANKNVDVIVLGNGKKLDFFDEKAIFGYSGDTDPPCPVMLTPHKDYGSENLND